MHHDRTDCSGVGAHDRLGQIGGNTTARHQIMIAAPIVPISTIVFRVNNVEILIRTYIQPKSLAALLDDIGLRALCIGSASSHCEVGLQRCVRVVLVLR